MKYSDELLEPMIFSHAVNLAEKCISTTVMFESMIQILKSILCFSEPTNETRFDTIFSKSTCMLIVRI